MLYPKPSLPPSLSTLSTCPSLSLSPDLYRSTILSLISQIRHKYNPPELKQLLTNIHRLQQYNMYKLARCNKELERQASFSFKLTEIENLLERFNMGFLKVLEDSPDYRLDDLYRRFVHINHKVGELDPEHMKVFGGGIAAGDEKVKIPKWGEKTEKETQKQKQILIQKQKLNIQKGKLLRITQQLTSQNSTLRQQISQAKTETQTVIHQLLQFRSLQQQLTSQLLTLQLTISDLQRKLEGKDEMLRQKDELVENYKTSIEKLKFSLLTPIKLTKTQKFVVSSAETVAGGKRGEYGNNNNTSRENIYHSYEGKEEEGEGRLSPGFRSEKGSCTPKAKKTPPKPPSSTKLIKPKSIKEKQKEIDNNQIDKYHGELPDLWSLLLVQCVSLEEMITANEQQKQ